MHEPARGMEGGMGMTGGDMKRGVMDMSGKMGNSDRMDMTKDKSAAPAIREYGRVRPGGRAC